MKRKTAILAANNFIFSLHPMIDELVDRERLSEDDRYNMKEKVISDVYKLMDVYADRGVHNQYLQEKDKHKV